MLTNKSKAEGPRGKALINLTPTLFARKVRYVNQQKQSRRTPWKGFDKPDPNSFCSKGEISNQQKERFDQSLSTGSFCFAFVG